MDASTRQKLADFRRALSEAINGSADACRTLDELRREGFSLYLLLDDRGELEAEGTIPRDRALLPSQGGLPVRAGRGWLLAPEEGSERGPDRNRGSLPGGADRGEPKGDPTFLLSARDVELLRGLGIDPTRKARRRRRSTD